MVQIINMLLNNRSSRKPTQTQPRQTQPTQTQPRQTQPTQTQPRQTQPTQTQPRQTQPRIKPNTFKLSTIYNSTRKSCG